MCFVALPLIVAGISAASAVVGFAAQQSNANAQARVYEQNQVSALAADRATQLSLTERQLQEQGATDQKLQYNAIDAARRQAAARVAGDSMGEAGGINLDSLVSDIGRRMDANRMTLMDNWNNTATQLQSMKEGANITEESRVNSQPAGNQPNALAPVLSVAGAGAKYFGDVEQQNRAAAGGTT